MAAAAVHARYHLAPSMAPPQHRVAVVATPFRRFRRCGPARQPGPGRIDQPLNFGLFLLAVCECAVGAGAGPDRRRPLAGDPLLPRRIGGPVPRSAGPRRVAGDLLRGRAPRTSTYSQHGDAKVGPPPQRAAVPSADGDPAPTGLGHAARWRATYFNRRWYEVTGLTPEKSLGDAWSDNLHPEDRQRIIDAGVMRSVPVQPTRPSVATAVPMGPIAGTSSRAYPRWMPRAASSSGSAPARTSKDRSGRRRHSRRRPGRRTSSWPSSPTNSARR